MCQALYGYIETKIDYLTPQIILDTFILQFFEILSYFNLTTDYIPTQKDFNEWYLQNSFRMFQEK